MKPPLKHFLTISTLAAATLVASGIPVRADHHESNPLTVVYEGKEGPGKGKHIVLISGDEEYRSEEAMPMLGKILATHHGFKCTVVFSITKGIIDPNNGGDLTGVEALDSADLMIIGTRFRRPTDKQMEHIEKYLDAGKPVIGLRTATHGFNGLGGKWAKYNNGYNGKDNPKWKDGFGRFVLGEKWISHHGQHGRQSARGIIVPEQKDHPILRGVKPNQIWGPSDVYGVRLPLPGDSKPLFLGAVLTGMKPDDPVLEGKKNDPMMPMGWTKSYESESGKKGRVFNTTMGASTDFVEPGLRRVIVNAAYWCLEMEDKIKADAKIDFVGEYNPTPFGFKRGDYWIGVGRTPADVRKK